MDKESIFSLVSVTGSFFLFIATIMWVRICMRFTKKIDSLEKEIQELRVETFTQIGTLAKIIERLGKTGEIQLNIIMTKLQSIEENVKDLNVRVSIVEVRLEERKPQLLLPSPMPVKRGRKPKMK